MKFPFATVISQLLHAQLYTRNKDRTFSRSRSFKVGDNGTRLFLIAGADLG